MWSSHDSITILPTSRPCALVTKILLTKCSQKAFSSITDLSFWSVLISLISFKSNKLIKKKIQLGAISLWCSSWKPRTLIRGNTECGLSFAKPFLLWFPVFRIHSALEEPRWDYAGLISTNSCWFCHFPPNTFLPSRFSRVQLCATPETAAHQASPSMGLSRQVHWSGLPFPSPMHESEKWTRSRSRRVWLLATPWTAAYQAPPSMGFSRQEYWSGVPLPSPQTP